MTPDLEDLYREIILDHYRNPRNTGELKSPPAIRTVGFNPLCGDEITLYLDIEGDILKDVKIDIRGCSISQSSASMMSEAIKGKHIAEIQQFIQSFKSMMSVHKAQLAGDETSTQGKLADNDPGEVDDNLDDDGIVEQTLEDSKLGELTALRGVVQFPVRIKCATLAWNTLIQGLEEVG
ncbi:MAG: SUF system NifU family Fe-S cluster assembly protein [Actinobacteria bacterium]|nr:SUF system NifU family Fe-S cluster assembly protein [Actinomycetota bacterium]MCL6104420.1 SUF system NifU family Fe-S cluster assembly protein [Actinomycetota bacterium]